MTKFKTPLFVFFIALIFVTACNKFDDPPAKLPTTYLNFINASADTLNFYVNGSRLNTLSSTYPLGSSGYIQSPLGEQNYQVKKFGHGEVQLNVPITLDSAGVYSFFATDGTVENSFTTKDSLYTLPDSVTSIRFVHTSPKLGAVDVTVGDTVKFRARGFKTTSIFVKVGPGIKRIRIYKAGTTQVLSDEERIIQSRRAYTLFIKSGLTDAGRTTPATGIIINK